MIIARDLDQLVCVSEHGWSRMKKIQLNKPTVFSKIIQFFLIQLKKSLR